MNTLKEFTTHLVGTKEVGLLISEEIPAENVTVVDPQKITEVPSGTIALALKEDNIKQMYDFCTQYATGQIDMSTVEGGLETYIPDYTQAVMLVATDKMLKYAQQAGFDFRAIAGITLRLS